MLHFCNNGCLCLDIAHHNRVSIAEGALRLDRFTPKFSPRLLCHLFETSTQHVLLKPENTGFRILSVWTRWAKITGSQPAGSCVVRLSAGTNAESSKRLMQGTHRDLSLHHISSILILILPIPNAGSSHRILVDSGHCEAWLRCLHQNAFAPANKLNENLKAVTGVQFTSRDILGDINRYHVMNNEQKAY